MKTSWPIKKLGEVAEIFNGKTPSRDEQRPSGLPILKIKDVNEAGFFLGFQSFVDEEFYLRYSNKKIKVGDTLVLNAAHNADYVGSKVFFANGQVDGVIATGEWTIIRPKGSVEPYMLHTVLTIKNIRNSIKEIVRGIHLYPKDLEIINIPIPSLDAQKKIVERLDAIRKAQDLCDVQISKAEELFESILNNLSTIKNVNYKSLFEVTDLVTDFVANGSFASLRENVKYSRVEDFAILIRLLDYSNKFKGPFVYINEHAYNFLSKSKLVFGDLILSNVGANLGTIFRVPNLNKPMSLGPNAVLIRSKKYDKFLYFWFLSSVGKSAIRSIVSQTGQPKFNKTDLRNIRVTVPEEKELQKIIEKLEGIQDYKKLLLKQKSLLKELFDSVLDKCMKGELIN